MPDTPTAEVLDNACKRDGIPIHGVSIGQRDDPSTWSVQFDGATPAQELEAAAIIENFDAEVTLWEWQQVRSDRDTLLYDCDWTQLPDSPLSDADKALWSTYRQSLRDLPANQSDPQAIAWPSNPSSVD